MKGSDIRLVAHGAVDRRKWDACISGSVTELPCGLSWYLDLVSPGWDGLIAGDYDAVFPLTGKRKYGISYLAQPFFAQQLGVFSRPEAPSELSAAMIGAIPVRYRLIEICLNEASPSLPGSISVRMNENYVLDLSRPHGEISSGYGENTHRNLVKAEKAGVKVSAATDPAETIALFRDNRGRGIRHWGEREYHLLERLVSEGARRSYVSILHACSGGGAVLAGAIFLEATPRSVLLFSGAGNPARETGAMTLLIDRYIAGRAGQSGALLDFEGSNDEGLARFYRGFGAVSRPYPSMRVNRLPDIVRWAKKLSS